MGVIANFKYYYRFEIKKRYLVNIDNYISTDITVLLKYDRIVNAWSNVKISTIVNCFGKCNFILDDESTIIYDNTDVANLNDFDLPDLMCVSYNSNSNLRVSYNDYISIDNNVLPYDNTMLSIPAIIESLITDYTEIIDNDCSEDNVKSTSAILNMIQDIQLYIKSNHDVNDIFNDIFNDNNSIHQCICKLTYYIYNIHCKKILLKKSTITDFVMYYLNVLYNR